jgi:hypothetical protein
MPTITNDNPTVPATNANEILDTNEEKDALLSFQLRARLAEIHFALIWKVMPSLGWKYSSNGHYHSPCLNGGADLGTSKEAMEQLDFCALKHLRFRNDSDQSRSTATGSNPKGNRDDDAASLSLCKLQNVRKALLTAIFYKCRETNDPLPCFYFDEVDETLEEIDPDRIGKKNVGRPSRSASRGRQGHTGNDASSRSATANEKGTEEYLGAKKKKNKLQKSSKVNLGDGKLKWPSARDCVEAAKAAAAKKNGPRLELAREKNDQFLDNCGADWKFLLNTNHSLLLHGVGSKKRLLDNFAATQLRSHGDILTFNGYDPSINITQILDVLVTLFLNGVEPSSAPINQVTAEDRECEIGLLRTPNQLTSIVVRRAIAIAKVLGGRHPRTIYMVIHNIDGIGLRNEDAQRALSVLMIHSNIVDCPKGGPVVEAKRVVRIVASTDHVDAPMLLWDLETMNNYSWVSGGLAFLSTCSKDARRKKITHLLLVFIRYGRKSTRTNLTLMKYELESKKELARLNLLNKKSWTLSL